MSLWTPSGEHPVDRRDESPPAPSNDPRPPGADIDDGPSYEDLTPEQRTQVDEMNRQMEAAQARMLSMPAGVVVGQQAMQFYEMAALYLSQQPPRLDDARLAIDALAGVAEKLGSGLGEAEQPVRQALHQLQLAFVQIAQQAGVGADGAAESAAAPAAATATGATGHGPAPATDAEATEADATGTGTEAGPEDPTSGEGESDG